MDPDIKYMRAALKEAAKAALIGEVPIGCVIVCDGKIVGRGYNRRNTKHTTLAHAELIAIDKASRKLGDWRLEGCTLYVTLEPCQMCSGAIVQSRIDRVVVGAMNPKAGCAGSILNILQDERFNHQTELTTGVMKEECAAVLQEFFVKLRIRNKVERMAEKVEIESEG
ncbi:MAG: tRNA adenosine(34) deaminase TadA [Lachnospiraceae bacterium]|nr:tRNA adenosine(34) deaminase TadA [Lachnospiraceae bacterium]